MAEDNIAMAEDASSAEVAQNLDHVVATEHGAAGVHVPGGPEGHHVEPTALGMNATGWVALAMIVVIAIMIWKKVPAIIGKGLDSRIATIRANLDAAARLRAEAEAILAHAREEAATIVAQAQADASALIERRGKMAEDKIGAAERAAVAEVRAKAASAAASAAASLIAQNLGADADRALVDQTIARLGSARLN